MRSVSLFVGLLVDFIALMVCATIAAGTVYAKPRPEVSSMTLSNPNAACDEVRRNQRSINCIVTSVQGHPTLAVEFVNERSMNAYLDAFSKQIAEPFCLAAGEGKEDAFFVVALKEPRVGSVSWCKTGESSGWLSLDALEAR